MALIWRASACNNFFLVIDPSIVSSYNVLTLGDVTLFAILMYKSYQGDFDLSKDTGYFLTDRLAPTDTNATDVSNASIALESKTGQILPDYLQLPASYNLTDLLLHLSLGVVSSELMYHFLCGFLQLYYYEMQRNQPEKWKCQPHRFLTRSNELHEIVVGTINLVIAGGRYMRVADTVVPHNINHYDQVWDGAS